LVRGLWVGVFVFWVYAYVFLLLVLLCFLTGAASDVDNTPAKIRRQRQMCIRDRMILLNSYLELNATRKKTTNYMKKS
ncbi:hypothetical protein, partial [Escherichia coli]|uniref:hypothetical protein n=1 Tax=Escherichia coli TaxID=562 RepID=UPI001BC87915